MTGNVQLYLAEMGRALTRMAGRLVGFEVGVKDDGQLPIVSERVTTT
jgi:hypothetical protein